MYFTTRQMTYTALFVAIAVICSFLTRFLASMTVPFSLIPFVVVLSGAILGKRFGPIALGIYILMGLIGIPVFATEPFGGFAYIFKPTFGFLLSYIPAAFVTGWVLEKGNSVYHYLVGTLLGMLVIYAVGVPYLWAILNFYLGSPTDIISVLKLAFLPYVGLDIVKAVIAAFIAKKVVSRIPNVQISKTA